MSGRESMPAGLSAAQCTARSKQTGEQCRQRVRGGGPCRFHGGASPQARRARERRLTMATALAADPRRDPGEVLVDVLHQADHLMRKARAEVDADAPTADTLAKLLEHTEQAGRWAKTTLDAGTSERQTRVIEAQSAALAGVITRVLDRLELSEAQRELVPVVVVEELERMAPGAEGADHD